MNEDHKKPGEFVDHGGTPGENERRVRRTLADMKNAAHAEVLADPTLTPEERKAIESRQAAEDSFWLGTF